jgi:hypothetical protein
MTPPVRSPGQRKHDALNRLDRDIDAWVATAGPANGAPHQVPLSFLWDGTTLLIATPADSVTSRNLPATGRARLDVGPTRDLVLIEGTVDAAQAAADIPPETGHAFAAKPASTRASSLVTSISASAPGGSRPGAKSTSSRAGN